jgi:hypothetical protein
VAHLSGARLGPYEIVELIGRGGMGEVYRAVDSRLGRQVAIKVLPAHLADHSESLARFRREARAIAALSHPNIVAVFDIGTQAETPYVVTELLAGDTLRTRLNRGKLSIDETLQIAIALAEGLAAAHAKGIIHRDLKPENVFLTASGGVKILDFGLASTQQPLAGAPMDTMTRGEALTEPGILIGTIGYMSPEQLRGGALTAATDVFSLGCVLYEMLAGEMPFHRDNSIEIITAVMRDDPFARPNAPEIPLEIRDVIDRCLQKDPRGRFQTGADVIGPLRSIAAAHATGQLTTASTMRVRLPMRRGRLAAIVALIVVVGVIAAIVMKRREVVDYGYDLHMSDISGTSETRRLTAVALRADAAGDRAEAIELLRQAATRDPHVPLPPAFLASFVYYNGDMNDGARWSAETRRRLGGASSTYETLLSRYLLPDNDGKTLMALASSLLELRPTAWRLRLSLAHRHLDRREMPAMLAQLKLIDVAAPDDRRLALVLADRASLGDIDAVERDLQRSALMQRPSLLAYTRARIASSRGLPGEAARLYDAAAESATARNLSSIAIDSRVLAGAARITAGDFEGGESSLNLATLKAHQAALSAQEAESYALAAYAAYRRGDREGMERRLRAGMALAPPGTSYYNEMRLFVLRTRANVPLAAGPSTDDSEARGGVATLIAGREAWARGDTASAARLLRQSRSEGVEATWFAEEAALLAYDLGDAPRVFRPDPPYPNRLRFMAVWELLSPRR